MDIIRRQTKKRPKHVPQQQHTYVPHSESARIELLDEYISRTRIADKNPPKKSIKKKGAKIFWAVFFLFTASVSFSIYTLYNKVNSAFEQMSESSEKHSVIKTISNIANPRSYESLSGFTDGRINILLLGRANSHKSGKDLTDTIMILSIDTKNYTVGLFSLPRDLLVSNGNFFIKINSLYQIGLREQEGARYIIDTVEDITSQKIHYYIVMDFEGFIDIINTLDGINVDVPQHILDERYPGPGYSYETFEVYPGLQKFDGETALKYARTRHDIEGDFGRAKRQQQIMQAARNKAFSLGTIVHPTRITEILTTLGDHVHTNITSNDIEPFISLVKKLDTQNITNVVVDAWKPGSLLISARYYSTNSGISGLVPRIGSYKEIREHASNIFSLNKITQRKKDIAIESPTTITIINATNDISLARRIKNILQLIGFENVNISLDKVDTRDQTVVIDNTTGSKPFSLDELLKKIPATKSSEDEIEKYDTDFVIILGNDIVDTYTYTEITQDELEEENAKYNDK